MLVQLFVNYFFAKTASCWWTAMQHVKVFTGHRQETDKEEVVVSCVWRGCKIVHETVTVQELVKNQMLTKNKNSNLQKDSLLSIVLQKVYRQLLQFFQNFIWSSLLNNQSIRTTGHTIFQDINTFVNPFQKNWFCKLQIIILSQLVKKKSSDLIKEIMSAIKQSI